MNKEHGQRLGEFQHLGDFQRLTTPMSRARHDERDVRPPTRKARFAVPGRYPPEYATRPARKPSDASGLPRSPRDLPRLTARSTLGDPLGCVRRRMPPASDAPPRSIRGSVRRLGMMLRCVLFAAPLLGPVAAAQSGGSTPQQAPSISGIHIDPPAYDSTFELDDPIEIWVFFDTLVVLACSQSQGASSSNTCTGNLELELTIGSQIKEVVSYNVFSATKVIDNSTKEGFPFYYYVEDGDIDTDGLSISANALNVPSGMSIVAQGNRSLVSGTSLGSHAITNNESFKVDSEYPILKNVRFASTSHNESVGDLVFTLNFSRASAQRMWVNYDTGGTATVGADYASGVRNLMVPPGNKSYSGTIEVEQDNLLEGNEKIIMTARPTRKA